jgi:medium-chain acyl-[acyl-carrier-protein] hydrolase
VRPVIAAGPRMWPDPWLPLRAPRPQARLRLFCFPYAGRGASIYREWEQKTPSDIELCAVQLPGREGRLAEPRPASMEALVCTTAQALEPYLDLPFAVFGHSLGAAVAFEVARQLHQRRGVTPRHVFVSGRSGPHQRPWAADLHALPDVELIRRVQTLQGIPEEVMARPDVMATLMPLLRDDLRLAETYRASPGPTLECPVTAFGGVQDPLATEAGLDSWRTTTLGPFTIRLFPGGHFYLHEDVDQLIGAIATALLDGHGDDR